MTLFDGIGGLSQTRDLFTAPGSLLGYDPYFQDAQRFEHGGLAGQSGLAEQDVPVTYASLQDSDPYGANRTAEQRAASIMGISPVGVLGTLGTSAIGGLPGLALGALGAGIGAYRNVSEAEKMRAGMLPPEAYKTLGFRDTLATAWPELLGGRSYEEAITDKDLETMSKYGMGLAAGVGGDLVGLRGGYNLYTPLGTDFGRGLVTTREPGPRFTNPQARQEYQAQLDRARQFDIEARTSGNLANLRPWRFGPNVTQAQRPMLAPYTGKYTFNPTGQRDPYGNLTAPPEVIDAYYGGGIPGPSFTPGRGQLAPYQDPVTGKIDYAPAKARYDAIAAAVAEDAEAASWGAPEGGYGASEVDDDGWW